MKQPVDDILAERRRNDGRRRRLVSGSVAIAGHTLLAALIALAPAFAARRRSEVRDYMRVMIVPAKALGDATAASEPKKTPPKKPTPAVAVETPAIPKSSTKKEPERKPDPSPAPSSRNSASAVETPSAPTTEPEETARRGGPDGSAFGTFAFGSSEASFDDPNFQYGYYVQQMLALIGEHWVRPRANPDTSMVIHFNISRQGELTDIEVVTESGNRAFDLAGYRAVALASPLPPLPQSYRSDSLGVNLLIR